MNSGILVFIVGGCAGWVARSLYSVYKRKKIVKNILDMVEIVGNKLDENKTEDGESKDDDVIDIAEDIFKIVKEEIDE